MADGSADIDYAPLSAEPTAADMTHLRARVRDGTYGRPTRERYATSQRVGVMVAGMVGGLLGLIFAIMGVAALVRGDSAEAEISLWATAVVVLLGVALGWLASRSENRRWKDIWRLVRFAEANGLDVQPEAKVRLLPGSIFTTRAHASTSERVTWDVEGCAVEVARHHRSSGGSVPNSFDARYLAVRLGDVPRLSFTGARGPARPGTIAGPEVELGGSGDRRRRGTLTSLPGQADAARAFLTDELVDLLTDPDHPCNAETVDGWFFAYYPARDAMDADRWRHVVALADAVVRARTACGT